MIALFCFVNKHVVCKMGAVLRSDNFVEGVKIVLRAIVSAFSFALCFAFRPALVSLVLHVNHATCTLFWDRDDAFRTFHF